MLTQSQIDAIAEAVIQSMKPASAPNTENSAGNPSMRRGADLKKDKPVEASEVVPLGASFMMEKIHGGIGLEKKQSGK